MPVEIQHIRSLKDVKELNLTENPEWIKKSHVEKGDAYIDSHLSQYICPVVGIEMNGKTKEQFYMYILVQPSYVFLCGYCYKVIILK